MLRSIVLVALPSALAACSPNDPAPETVYDPCSPLHVAITESRTDDEQAGVEGAIAAWQARLPTQISVQLGASGTPDPAVLPLRFITGSALRAVYWDHEGTISISIDKLSPGQFPVAIAHEMGHAFGLEHVPASERISVMNVGNTTVPPTAEDAAEVAALWASCER